MRDSKDSVKFMQVLDRGIFLRLKEIARTRGVTVQELIRVLVIPDWMRRSEEESNKAGAQRRRRRMKIRSRLASIPLVRVRTPPTKR